MQRLGHRFPCTAWCVSFAGLLALGSWLVQGADLAPFNPGAGAGPLAGSASVGEGSALPQQAEGCPHRDVAGELNRSSTPRLLEAYGRLPLSFEANRGQTDPQVKFLARGRGYTLFVTDSEAVLSLRARSLEAKGLAPVKFEPQTRSESQGRSEGERRLWAAQRLRAQVARLPRFLRPLAERLAEQARFLENLPTTARPPSGTSLLAHLPESAAPGPESRSLDVVRLTLVGVNPEASILGLDELPGKSNYFIGNDPKKWCRNVPTFSRVKHESVYPGIDLIYYGNQGRLEHDFVVSPGADPKAIRLAIEGAENISVDGRGNLVVNIQTGKVVLNRPHVYQSSVGEGKSGDSKAQPLDGRYTLVAKNQVGFEVGAYDRSRPLIIDPVLEYSTYLGGSEADDLYGLAVDGAGSAYVVGETFSADFPTRNPLQSNIAGGPDVFVTKLNASGTDLVYSTYLGGTSYEYGYGIAVDSAGSAYITGDTGSPEFPTTVGAFQEDMAGYADVFITKLNPEGSGLEYSTFLGGLNPEWEWGSGTAISTDSSGNVYVLGYTSAADFPTTPGAFDRTCGDDGCNGLSTDLFVSKLDPTLSTLLYSTYLGTPEYDFPFGPGIAADSSGGIHLASYIWWPGFPLTSGAFDPTCGTDNTCDGGYSDGVYARIDPAQAGAASLTYSTYIGGSDSDGAYGLTVDAVDKAFVTGWAASLDFPSTSGAFQPVPAGGTCGTAPDTYRCADAFLMRFDPTLSGNASLVYSTFLGGTGDDAGYAVRLNAAGSIYVAGDTASEDFPLANPTQATYGGGTCAQWGTHACYDNFLSKFNAAGSALIFSTYLGGNEDDYPYGVGIDAMGNAYLAGRPGRTSFPTTPGAFQQSSTDVCAPYPPDYIPFTQVHSQYYDATNRILLGEMTPEAYNTLLALPLPTVLDERFCDYVTIASDYYGYPYTTSAYVPTASERLGDFSYFQGEIIDPNTGLPYPGNIIPPPTTQPGPFAWRLASSPGGGDGFVAKFANLVAPLAGLSATSLTFTSQLVGTTSASQTVRVSNLGDAALTFSSIAASGDFAVATSGTTCSTTAEVAPGGRCNLAVTFSPTDTGERLGTLTLATNAAETPYAVELSGTGTDFSIAAATGSSTSATVDPGQTATYTLTLDPDGFSGTASLSCTENITAATCSLSANSVTLDGTTPVDVTVRVETTARAMVPPFGGHRQPLQGPALEPSDWPQPLVPSLALAAVLALVLVGATRRVAHKPLLAARLALAGTLLCLLTWAACGGGEGPPPPQGTPAGTYTVTVTATAGSATRSIDLTLTVR